MTAGVKVKRVRAEPGGLVDLEFTADGWTARLIEGSRPNLTVWCAIWMAAALGLAGLAQLAGLSAVRKVFLVIAAILLFVALVLVVFEFAANMLGFASLTSRAIARGRVRAESKDLQREFFEAQRREEYIQAARVVSASVLLDVRGTAVELTLDDGTYRRYIRKRDGLVQPFRELLGSRFTPRDN